MRPRYAAVCLAAAITLITGLRPAPGLAQEVWELGSGRLTLHFNTPLLEELDVTLDIESTPGLAPVDPWMESPHWTLGVEPPSNLRIQVDDGIIDSNGVDGGRIQLSGALEIATRGTTTHLEAPRLTAEPSADLTEQPTLHLVAPDGEVVIDFVHTMFHMDSAPNREALNLHYMNMLFSEDWCARVGRPDLVDWVIGSGELRATLTYIEGTSRTQGPDDPDTSNPTLDIKLGILGTPQQIAREGGQLALSMATTACNVGNVNVPWEAPMDEDHPLIFMALYRELDGQFDQIGVSWLKHGFFALSNSQCTPCQNQSNGSFLGVGCSDTYGVSNNADRRYLGPRTEVDPFQGSWTCTGSHFAGGVNDCQRRHGSSGHGALDHRLVVAESDLQNAGATYYFEAYYIVADDVDRFNNWGSRPCTMSQSGSTWSFQATGSLREGPALDRWGDARQYVAVPGDGQVLVAAKVVDGPGGTKRYHYAVQNLDADRKIRAFTVPLAAGVTVSDLSFHDSDQDTGNDWTATTTAAAVTWETDTFGQNPSAHALVFGDVFSFSLTANTDSETGDVLLGIFESGTGTEVTASMPVPGAGTPPPPPDGTNLARYTGTTVSQSSTDFGGVPERAADGNTNGDYFADSVSHTGYDNTAWWQADLADSYPITEVQIYNRTDCCSSVLSDFYVLVSDAPFVSNDLAMILAQPGVDRYYYEGEVPGSATLPIGRAGKYVRLQLTAQSVLTIAEFEIIAGPPGAGPVNLCRASGATPSQSSTDYGGDPERACDGDTNGDFFAGSVTHTSWQSQPYWQVDLGTVDTIGEVTIFNRSDCCTSALSNFYVLVSEQPFVSADLDEVRAQPGVEAYYVGAEVAGSENLSIVRDGRYVRVQLAGQNVLTLAEVQVWSHTGGPPPVNYCRLPETQVSQSSLDFGGVPERACDGDTNGDYFAGSVTHTGWDFQPWWEADLAEVRSLDQVTVWNRTDCCDAILRDFYLLVSDDPFVSQDLASTRAQPGVREFHQIDSVVGSITFDVGGTGRYLRVQLVEQNVLTLAEVEIWSGSVPLRPESEAQGLVGSRSPQLLFGSPFPNPFKSTTQISYELTQPENVRVAVYDVKGRRIRTLVDGTESGYTTLTWDGTNDQGARVGNGIYWITLQSDSFSERRKVVQMH